MERQGIHLPVRVLILATLLVSGIAVAEDGEPRGPAAPAEALTTAFTYQGQLEKDGSPVNDACDMAFRLYDEAVGGTQVGSAITATVPITDGLFTVRLDFGAGAFNGDRRWLGIAVDCDGVGSYADLGRQELTAAPYALYAMGAPWGGLAGVPAGFADGVDDDTTYSAGEGLVLDGTEFSAQGSPYANVVVVAKSGGDYPSIKKAIDSISDAAEDNAYLVWVAPGVYEEQVAMKPYVHLQGAGQEATVITSTASSSSWPPGHATLVLTRATSLRDLTVGNGGTGLYNVALLATTHTAQTLVVDVTARARGGGSGARYAIFLIGIGTDVTLQHVTGLAENGSGGNYGLSNREGAQVTLHGGSFTARRGYAARGIRNFGSGARLRATGVTALGEKGSSENAGLVNSGGAGAMLHGGSFFGRGGSYAAYGIFNANNGTTLEAEGVTALGEENNYSNHGLYNEDGAAATLHGGSFIARGGSEAYGICNLDSGTTLEATDVIARGDYGLINVDDATAEVDSSRLTGSTYGLQLAGGTVYVGVTQLDGGAYNSGGTLTCFEVYDGSYGSYTCP